MTQVRVRRARYSDTFTHLHKQSTQHLLDKTKNTNTGKSELIVRLLVVRSTNVVASGIAIENIALKSINRNDRHSTI